MCSECRNLIEQYDAGTVRLCDAAAAMRAALTTPDILAHVEHVESLEAHCRDLLADLDRHFARHYRDAF